MRNLKIILSVLFVCAVSFLVVRGCLHKKATHYETAPKGISKKKITFRKPAVRIRAKEEATVPAEALAVPRMAIILDDWGHSFALTKYAIAIKRPITLSILPHLPHSARIAEEAFNNNLEVMLHMPMQPKNRSKGLEPHTILVTTPDDQILSYLDEALESVPHVDGVNNHMGSAATSDLRVMRVVLSHLSKKGLFFIDSHTASSTVGPQVAKEAGIKFNNRDVFLDNELTPEAIRNQMEKAKAIALKRGTVIVIGHDKKMTMTEIQAMVPEIEAAGIQLVLAKDLAE